jgi:hypothetical protein
LRRRERQPGGEGQCLGVGLDLGRVVLGFRLDVGGRTGGVGLVVHDEQAIVSFDDEVDDALDDAAAEFGDDGDLFQCRRVAASWMIGAVTAAWTRDRTSPANRGTPSSAHAAVTA